MQRSNGNVLMKGTVSPMTLSPKTFSSSKGTPESMTSSTFDDASLDELDRIMDTLSTLSRETSMVRNEHPKFFATSPLASEQINSQPSFTGSGYTTPYPAMSPQHTYSTTTTASLPPPMTSPPRTPVTQSPRHYTSNPKVMTLSGPPSQDWHVRGLPSETRSPATMPRLPSNPYENTSILHGSHFVRPSNTFSNEKPASYTNTVTESPMKMTLSSHTGYQPGNYFFGPLPVSPQSGSEQRYPPTGPKPSAMTTSSGCTGDNTFTRSDLYDSEQPGPPPPRSPTSTARESPADNAGRRQAAIPRTGKTESLTIPAYNEKRSYLKNLEKGTLPRPRIDSARNEALQNLPACAAKVLNGTRKQTICDDPNDAFARVSLRKPSKSAKRGNGKFRLQNLSKTPSRHSTSSFNSYDLGRGYASVSTAPASTHGLIQTEVLPHRQKEIGLIPVTTPTSSEPSKDGGHCCVRSGRFLYSHILEMFIVVAFCAGLPIGIILQATAFHASSVFEKYFTFWGRTMLIAVLSTITPLLVISSMLTGIANLTIEVIRRLSLLATIYYFLSVASATCIAIAFSKVIKPGAGVSQFAITNVSLKPALVHIQSGEIGWPDATLLAQQGFLKDDGLSTFALNEDNYVYNTSNVANVTASDEILRLFSLFFPGCGTPSQNTIPMCNLFVLVMLSAVIGIGASRLEAEGSSVRHVIAQTATLMSKMSDIILWYVPIGIIFLVSELVATRVDWANIGHDRVPSSEWAGQNDTSAMDELGAFNDATKWYFVTVISSLVFYSLVVMPLVVCLLTLTNPFSLLGFRSLAPLLAATTTGFSDLCIPLTVRCLLRNNQNQCCLPHAKVDRRIARVSAVLGGLFHRGGSTIVVVCTSLFFLEISERQTTIFENILICLSAMITSVTSLGGRWFQGSDPLMRAMVIGLTSAGLSAPNIIPRAVVYLWLISRFAAFADTIIDILGAHLLNRACKSKLPDVAMEQECRDRASTSSSSNVDTKTSVIAPPSKKLDAVRSVSGEGSDYEDAPLLFSRREAANESDSGSSRVGVASNDDSVFLPNRPQEGETNRDWNRNATTAAVNAAYQHRQPNGSSTNRMALHSTAPNQVSTNHQGVPDQLYNHSVSSPPNRGQSNRDEVSFVTF